MKGAGKHEGQVQLQEAYFTTAEELLIGGKFTVDMNSIQVTDIPKNEPVPRQRFNNHMKSEDFFQSEIYPTSKFEITNIEQITTDSLKVSGNRLAKCARIEIQRSDSDNLDGLSN